MPSRLIQGLDTCDTCSQFSDTATLHTLTRIGALQKAVYFSRSESSCNNLDTISYGNSSTCCCDAEIKMDLQLRNSIYQCNPRCGIEKKPKLHPSFSYDCNTQILDKFDRDKEKQRKNRVLNQMTNNYRIEQNPFYTIDTYEYSAVHPKQKSSTARPIDSEIDIESIPLPPSAVNRRATSFRIPHHSTASQTSLSKKQQLQRTTVTNNRNKQNNQLNQSKKNASFKLVDLLNSQKNKITSIDMHQFNKPKLNHLNAKIKKIYRNTNANDNNKNTNSNNSLNSKKNATLTHDKKKYKAMLDPFLLNKTNEYNPHLNVNHLMEKTVVPDKCNTIGPKCIRNEYLANGFACGGGGGSGGIGDSIGGISCNDRFGDIRSLHASTCNLGASFRTSNQSIINNDYCSNSAMNLKYGSLRSYKEHHRRRANSEQLNSSYYQFPNIDGDFNEMENCNAFDSVLLPTQQLNESQKYPWKHRQCPSIISSSSSTSITTKWDLSKHWLAITSILLIIGAAGVAVPLALRVASGASFDERLQLAYTLLENVPLIDGHNDLPYNIRKFVHNHLADFDFDMDLKTVPPWSHSNWSHTDLNRLKKGRVSAQFWAAYVPCEAQYKDAVQVTLEQIDVIIRLTDKYSDHLTLCTASNDIATAHKNRKICSLIGVEGGHSMSNSLAVLRTFYLLGVRYMTLTSTCHTPWADSSYADAPKFDKKHGGLTEFGKTIIKEMNRLGMIVDLSHVSMATMRDAINYSEAPVIFSHSSAYELCNSSRNVQDSILKSIVKNRGLIMLNFYSMFLNCGQNATVYHAVAHLNHIKRVASVDYIGIGAGYDGINYTPSGLEDVSKYPVLFAELLGVGWSVEELTKLAGGNFLRVMAEVEIIRDKMKEAHVQPYEDLLNTRLDDPYNCTTS